MLLRLFDALVLRCFCHDTCILQDVTTLELVTVFEPSLAS